MNTLLGRLTHVTVWLKAREPDVLLLQELKGTEFPSEAFKSLGYESVVRRLKLTKKEYRSSLQLKAWVQKHKDSKYVPQDLLEAWEIEANV